MNQPIDVGHLCLGCMSKLESKKLFCPFCGFSESSYTPSPHQLPLNTILNGKYLVGRVLGEGGFGITYLGWDLNLDMKVAIKEYYPSGYVTRESFSTLSVTFFTGDKREAFQAGLDKFVGEAKSLAKFYSLPGIVSVKDFFRENATAYIVMEYIEGTTLKEYLGTRGGKIPVSQALELMKPLIRSLDQMHGVGIIHRDISPDNIMITHEGDIKLLDFGAARDISIDGAKSLSVLLKPGYAPEEQYRTRGSQGPWTDVYALCATLYKTITGETPIESMERLHQDDLKPPSTLGVSIGKSVEEALLKGLSLFQQNRFQSMKELYDALIDERPMSPQPLAPSHSTGGSSAISSSPVVHASYTGTKAHEVPSKKKKWIPILAVILLVASIYPLILLLGPSEDEEDAYDDSPRTTQGKEIKPSATPGKEASPTPTPEESPVAAVNGNLPGNIVNYGGAAFQDGWIYYKNYDDGLLYKARTDGSGYEKLCDDDISYINVLGDWIYYVNESTTGIYKIKTDGTGRTELSSDEATDMIVSGDWIYYVNLSDEFFLYRMRTDGSDKTQLNHDFSSDINVVGDTIYYSDYSVNNIVRIDIDGRNKVILNEIDACFTLVVSGNYIYYRNNSDGGKLYKIQLDGNRRACVNQDDTSSLNVVEGWVYYRNNSDEGSLYKMRTDGTERTKLNNVSTNSICVVGPWIYYYNLSEETGGIYNLSTDSAPVAEPETSPENQGTLDSLHIEVLNSIAPRLNSGDFITIEAEEYVETENQVHFMVNEIKEMENEPVDGLKFVRARLQISKSEAFGGILGVADYNFILLFDSIVDEANVFPLAYSWADGEIKEFPVVLDSSDPLDFYLYYMVPIEATGYMLVNTNFFDGEGVGPVYVYNSNEE